MLAGHCPFRGADSAKTRCNILNNDFSMEDLESVSSDVKDLITRMLEPCPKKRLTAQKVRLLIFAAFSTDVVCQQVLKHQWLHQGNKL